MVGFGEVGVEKKYLLCKFNNVGLLCLNFNAYLYILFLQ